MIFFTPSDKVVGAFLGRCLEDPGEEFFQVEQVHGNEIVQVRGFRDAASKRRIKADAIITNTWALPIAVRTADCVPILLAHPSRVVAAVHAGWRGTKEKILEKVIRRMEVEYQADPKDISMAVGPAICRTCYEVGEDVARHFAGPQGGDFCRPKASSQKFELDLKSVNVAQALATGIHIENLSIHPECTRCREDLFYSHRAALARGEEKAGRNYSWVMISP